MEKHHISKENFRTINIVKNMNYAYSVVSKDGFHEITFNIQYYNRNIHKMEPSKLIYVINSNLVNDLRKREKIEII